MASRTITLLLFLMLPFSSFSSEKAEQTGFDSQRLIKEASEFFGVASEEIAKLIIRAFEEHGKPTAYIKGEEAGGALGVGIRFGKGELQTADGVKRKVKWDGPSVGLDIGINASKVLILVYQLNNVEDLYQKYGSIEGSLYVVAGAGMNYMKAKDIVLAPIRVGVGWRQGASIGFVRFYDSEKKDAI